MSGKESNKEYVIDFLRKAASLRETDQDDAIEKLKDVFVVIGYDRAVAELLPILVSLSNFYSGFRVARLIREIPIIDFELKKQMIVDGLLMFFSEFLNSEEEELRSACLRKIAAILCATADVRRFHNFLNGLHASDGAFRRPCIFEFLSLDFLPIELFQDSVFFEGYFGRLLDEPSAAMRRPALKLMLNLYRKFPTLFSYKFLRSTAKQLTDDKVPAIQMYAVVLALKSADPSIVEETFWKALKSKNPYCLRALFDNSEATKAIKPSLFGDEFVSLYTALFYETDTDIRNMALDAMDMVVRLIGSDSAVVKILNNAKQSVATNATKDAKYNVMTALLKTSAYLTREQSIELILKHLLGYLREEQESFDVYFIQSLRPFVLKCGYEVLRESLDLFFRAIIIHCSQGVCSSDEDRTRRHGESLGDRQSAPEPCHIPCQFGNR